jgi:drug/metabolite transporter superfamily protein YnfA
MPMNSVLGALDNVIFVFMLLGIIVIVIGAFTVWLALRREVEALIAANMGDTSGGAMTAIDPTFLRRSTRRMLNFAIGALLSLIGGALIIALGSSSEGISGLLVWLVCYTQLTW